MPSVTLPPSPNSSGIYMCMNLQWRIKVLDYRALTGTTAGSAMTVNQVGFMRSVCDGSSHRRLKDFNLL